MTAAILLNGDPYSGEIKCDRAYCCDGAYMWAAGKVKIDENLGDFDSLAFTPEPPPEKIYPAEKNFTDGEIALYKAVADGADEIIFYGGTGGRSDHFLGNLHLLYAAHMRGAKCSLESDSELIFPASGKIFLGKFAGRTLSVLPFGGELHILKSAGLKYSYPDRISYGECRGISNICLSADAYLEVAGLALVIINKGEV